MAEILEELGPYLNELKKSYKEKRDFFVTELRKRKVNVLLPQGSYFVLAEIPQDPNYDQQTDVEFCVELVMRHKLTAVPLSAFYSKEQNSLMVSRYIRFCFAKEFSTLKAGAERFPC